MTSEMKVIEAKARELYPIRPRNFAVEIEVFKLAWEYGHSHGESEVMSYYCDLAELAQKSISAATSADFAIRKPSNAPAEVALEQVPLEGDAPRRCKTGEGDPQNMECMDCGAALGEICRKHSTDM